MPGRGESTVRAIHGKSKSIVLFPPPVPDSYSFIKPDALVAISTTYESKGIGAARALAEEIIDSAYGYQYGAVLFKPTLTMSPQTFRITPPCPIPLEALT